MQLSPRYDGPPLITIDGPVDDQRETVARQRRRMAAALAELSDEQWAAPSRCEGWSGQDVVNHLIGTNQFWHLSMMSGLAGAPTQILAAFDPAATPAAMVEPMRAMSPADSLAQLVETGEALLAALDALDSAGWATIAETPPGHLPIRLLAHHALWDAWVHDRDVLLPLGADATEEPDEVVACLRYAAALAPALATMSDERELGTVAIRATDPDIELVLEVGDDVAVRTGAVPAGVPTLTGSAVDLLEMLSIRAPLDPSTPPEWRRMLRGLSNAFDQPVTSS